MEKTAGYGDLADEKALKDFKYEWNKLHEELKTAEECNYP
jgi:hypothetical protein